MIKINKLFLLVSISCLTLSASADEERAAELALNCYTCHSTNNESLEGIPQLTGLSAQKIEKKLLLFRLDQQQATIMNRIAKGYTEAEIKAIANYLAEEND